VGTLTKMVLCKRTASRDEVEAAELSKVSGVEMLGQAAVAKAAMAAAAGVVAAKTRARQKEEKDAQEAAKWEKAAAKVEPYVAPTEGDAPLKRKWQEPNAMVLLAGLVL
jgi:hypothetical protein